MYIKQQDAQNSCDQTLLSIRCSTCFGLYQSIIRSNFISCTSHLVYAGICRYHTSVCCVAVATQQPNVPYKMIHGPYNIQSTLRTAPRFCKNVSLQCYLVPTVLHTQSLRRYVYIYTHSSQYRGAGGAKEIKKHCDISECRVPRKFSRLPFGHACHSFVSLCPN